MKRAIFCLLIGVAIIPQCRAGKNPLSGNFWDQYDSAERSRAADDIPPLTMAVEALGTPSEVSPVVAPVEDLFRKNYWYLLLLDVKEVSTAPARWDRRDWLVLGGLTAGIGTVAMFDRQIERAIRRNRTDAMTTFLHGVQPLGNEYAAGIMGAFYFAGEVFKDPRAKTTALDSIAASAIASGVVTNALKYTIGRARPIDGLGPYNFQPFGGHDSFSSGHTSEAFALASVISEHYDTPWVKFASYGLAGTVGYARLNNNRHWPSDVLSGAVIGTFVGKTVVHFNQKHRTIKLQPIVGPNVHGAELSMAW